MIDTELHLVLLESKEIGVLPHTMMQGDITILYKKGDPRSMKNYRPITLLNIDYKIFSWN